MISSLETYKKENKVYAPNEEDRCLVCNLSFNKTEGHIIRFDNEESLLGYIHDKCVS